VKKQAIKQGMMQQLLSGRSRLPGFNGMWSSHKLGELGTFLKGRGIKREDVTNYGVPCIRYGELYTTYHNYTTGTVSYVSPMVASSALPIGCGDLLFAGSGETRDEIGTCAAYMGKVPAVAGGDIVVLRGFSFDPVYLAILCNTSMVGRQKARLGQGDAVVHISSRALAQVEVFLPGRGEQAVIASVIKDADADLAALQSRLEKTRGIKQGMMQELLTGRVRLPYAEAVA
jgi:type I restriction enzyme S subunit